MNWETLIGSLLLGGSYIIAVKKCLENPASSMRWSTPQELKVQLTFEEKTTASSALEAEKKLSLVRRRQAHQAHSHVVLSSYNLYRCTSRHHTVHTIHVLHSCTSRCVAASFYFGTTTSDRRGTSGQQQFRYVQQTTWYLFTTHASSLRISHVNAVVFSVERCSLVRTANTPSVYAPFERMTTSPAGGMFPSREENII